MNLPECRPFPALEGLHYDNRFAALPESYYARVQPTPLAEPRLASFNPDAAALLDLDAGVTEDPAFVEVMAGNRLLPGMDPVAAVYAGHQFGVFVPQLGDGRAILLGQVCNRAGEHWEVQIKGAGPTPYSRFADGRAVLRSTIREYLASEALHGLGIPTTRALSIVVAPLEDVYRETVESAAVLCRLAPSHVRFGSFEYFYCRREHDRLKLLADHVINGHFADLADRPDKYAAWLTEVLERTARLMAQWQSVGFVHGVMNTDNFSVLGLTLDYGPYGFMDAFDAHRVFNHTDEGGRYAWDQQPQVGHWNVSRLLQASLPLLDKVPEKALEIANGILGCYRPAHAKAMLGLWGGKLGLREVSDDDRDLIDAWLSLLDRSKADFTRCFRGLSQVVAAGDSAPPIRDEIADIAGFDSWLGDYRQRLQQQAEGDVERATRMNAANPKYVLRNHLAQHAIERAQADDFSEIETLRLLLSRPFDEQPEHDAYAEEPPEALRHLELSCSS